MNMNMNTNIYIYSRFRSCFSCSSVFPQLCVSAFVRTPWHARYVDARLQRQAASMTELLMMSALRHPSTPRASWWRAPLGGDPLHEATFKQTHMSLAVLLVIVTMVQADFGSRFEGCQTSVHDGLQRCFATLASGECVSASCKQP